MKKYLITGGAGFIGANYIEFLFETYNNEIQIINFDKLTHVSNLDYLSKYNNKSNYYFIKGDICDSKLVQEILLDFDIDYIINFAAESHVDRSIVNSADFVKTNIVGTTNLLSVAKEVWALEKGFCRGKKFLQISTDEVYGASTSNDLFNEKSALNPRNPYAASKASAEFFAKSYYITYGFPVVITRSSNIYGKFQFSEKLIPMTITNLLKYKNIPIYGNGKQIREWLYVKDQVRALDLVLNKGRLGEVYNIGSGEEIENINVVKKIIALIKEKTNDDYINNKLINFVNDRLGHDKRYGIDSSKIKNELGWEPKVEFKIGISETIDWFLSEYSF